MSTPSERSPGPDSGFGAARHELASGLQILALTAELLGLELRNGAIRMERVQRRGLGLDTAMQRVTTAARLLPLRSVNGDDAGNGPVGTFADSGQVREIRGVVRFITDYIALPGVDRDILAEYVEWLHARSARLIGAVNG